MHKTTSGFTIVELLVVIVVIGILASITVVAYSGVRARASDAAIMSDLKAIGNQLLIYQTTHAKLPYTADELREVDIRPSKTAYGAHLVSGGANYNLLYCVTDDTSKFALFAGSQSGMVFRYANGTLDELPGGWPGNGWGVICPAAFTPNDIHALGRWLHNTNYWQICGTNGCTPL